MIRALSVVLLLAVATPALAADPVKPPVDPNKVRCKRETVTGSLASTNKVCHTEAEWHQIAEQAREETTRMQSSLNSRGGGN